MEDFGLKPSSSESEASVCSSVDILAGVQPRACLHTRCPEQGMAAAVQAGGWVSPGAEGHLPREAARLMGQQRGGERMGGEIKGSGDGIA